LAVAATRFEICSISVSTAVRPSLLLQIDGSGGGGGGGGGGGDGEC